MIAVVRCTRVPPNGVQPLEFPARYNTRASLVVKECRKHYGEGSLFDINNHVVLVGKHGDRDLEAGEYKYIPGTYSPVAAYIGGFASCPVEQFDDMLSKLGFTWKNAQDDPLTVVDFSEVDIKLEDFKTSSYRMEADAMAEYLKHTRTSLRMAGIKGIKIHNTHRLPYMFSFVLGQHAVNGNLDAAATVFGVQRWECFARMLFGDELKLNPALRPGAKKTQRVDGRHLLLHRRQAGLTLIGATKANKLPVVVRVTDGIHHDILRLQDRNILYNQGLTTSEAYFLLNKLLSVDAKIKKQRQPPSDEQVEKIEDQKYLSARRHVCERTQS